MYKSKEKQKEATKERVRRYREKQKGVTLEEGVTEEAEDITPAIINALVDPKKRAMLEFVSADLKRKHLGEQLRYGVYGPDFSVIAELLEVTA